MNVVINRNMCSKSKNCGMFNYVFKRNLTESELSIRGQFRRTSLGLSKNLYTKDLKGHFGCVNAIEFSPQGGDFIASGGDDRRVLLWNVEKAISGAVQPVVLKGEHHSNIFCLSFDVNKRKIFSGGNDEQVIVHDIESGETSDVFLHEEAVYGLSADPLNESIVASACDDGRVLIIDIRQPASEEPFCLAQSVSPMHAVMYNPMESRLLATANSKDGVMLWDIRKPKSHLVHYGSQQSCMSVRVSSNGRQILALRRRLPPVLYNLHSPLPVCQFDQPGYYNSCTMKSCSFAGDNDQYILCGSDDFNVYMWEIPEEPHAIYLANRAHLVLRGHRSIVNQVRYNPANQMIISSGVEKILKLWSPYGMPDSVNSKDNNLHAERPIFSHEEYINLVLRSGQVLTHDYSNGSTEEDPRMMAFFDSLVQRELQGWSSDENNSDVDSNGTSSSHGYLLFLPSEDSLDSSEAENPSSENGNRGSSSGLVLTSASDLLSNHQGAGTGVSGGGGLNASTIAEGRPPASGLTARILLETLRNVAPPDLLSVGDIIASSSSISAEQQLMNSIPRGISRLIEEKRKDYVLNIQEMARRSRAEHNGETSTSGEQVDHIRKKRRRLNQKRLLRPFDHTSANHSQALAEINYAFGDLEPLRHSSSSSEDLLDFSLSSSSDEELFPTGDNLSQSAVSDNVLAADKTVELPDANRNRILNRLRKLRQSAQKTTKPAALHSIEAGSSNSGGAFVYAQPNGNKEKFTGNDDYIPLADSLLSAPSCSHSRTSVDQHADQHSACMQVLVSECLCNANTEGNVNVDNSVTDCRADHSADVAVPVSIESNRSDAAANEGNVRWEEFCRFKHHLERTARRKYRRHSHPDSGDDHNDCSPADEGNCA